MTNEPPLLSPDVPITLTNCDLEPIHIPGLIQPHGLLLAVRAADLRIAYASENTRELLGVEARKLLEGTLHAVLGNDKVACLQRALRNESLSSDGHVRLPSVLHGGSRFEVVVHRRNEGSGALLVVEMQPSAREKCWESVVDRLQRCTRELECPTSLDHLFAVAVPMLRRETGYDRTMVYRFDKDGHGEVLAEDKAPEMESFLGLHYPATDIPRQARQLYLRQRLRIIVDTEYTPVRVLVNPRLAPAKHLDMTYCNLRSISPMHLEYLKNMGVRSSFSVSLIVDNCLWGLMLCHHREPRNLEPETLAVCEQLGTVLSLLIIAAQKAERETQALRNKAALDQLGERLEVHTSLARALEENRRSAARVDGCGGAP